MYIKRKKELTTFINDLCNKVIETKRICKLEKQRKIKRNISGWPM